MSRLTIDEVIKKQRNYANLKREAYETLALKEHNIHLLHEAKNHEQVVEWLEELKAIKEKGRYVQGFRAGYKVAVDDFTNRMLEEGVIGLVQFSKIKEIAEQLKEQK